MFQRRLHGPRATLFRIALSLVMVLTLGVSSVDGAGAASGSPQTTGFRWNPGTVLTYRFGTGVPAWAQTAVKQALEEAWVAPGWDNHLLPRFQYDPKGKGIISYSSRTTSVVVGAPIALVFDGRVRVAPALSAR